MDAETSTLLQNSMTSSIAAFEPPKVRFGSSRPTSRSGGGLGSIGLLSPVWQAPALVRSRSEFGRGSGVSSALITEADMILRRGSSLRMERAFGGHFYLPAVAAEPKYLFTEARTDPFHSLRIKQVKEMTRRRRAEAAAKGDGGRPKARVTAHLNLPASQLVKLKRKLAHQAIREHAMAVMVSDVSGDFSLDFDEFTNIVANRLPDLSFAPKTLRSWFDTLDDDKGGSIALPEYFAFAIKEAIMRVDYVYPVYGAHNPTVERKAQVSFPPQTRCLLVALASVEVHSCQTPSLSYLPGIALWHALLTCASLGGAHGRWRPSLERNMPRTTLVGSIATR